MENNYRRGASIIWNEMVQDFDIVGSGLAWRVGYGHWVRLEMDPWVGSGRVHILHVDIIMALSERGVLFLSQVVDPATTTISNQRWLEGVSLNLVAKY